MIGLNIQKFKKNRGVSPLWIAHEIQPMIINYLKFYFVFQDYESAFSNYAFAL